MGGSDSNVGPGRIAFQSSALKEVEQEYKKSSHHPVEAPVGEMIQDENKE